MMIKMTQTQEELFNSALESLPLFVEMFDADWEMVCDFMEAQCGGFLMMHGTKLRRFMLT